MWTDIDYMYKRWIFTNDPQYFPTDRMREIIDYLHGHEQQYSAYIQSEQRCCSSPTVRFLI